MKRHHARQTGKHAAAGAENKINKNGKVVKNSW